MDLSEFYPPRPEESRKGDFGRVVVVGGSERYAGAPAFNALGALRAGADLAIVVAPRRSADILAGYAPDLITVPCNTPFPTPDLTLSVAANADAAVIGGGIDRTAEAHKSLVDIVRRLEVPMVLDAEALHAVAEVPKVLAGKTVLMTPHGGEFQVLSGEEWPREAEARKEAARDVARRYGVTVIVKGRFDVVTDGERVHVDEAGSPYLTKGGYGDLLAGVAAAHLARGRTPFDAARVSAYVVGRAGELAAAERGESLVASDALARFPDVLRSVNRAA